MAHLLAHPNNNKNEKTAGLQVFVFFTEKENVLEDSALESNIE